MTCYRQIKTNIESFQDSWFLWLIYQVRLVYIIYGCVLQRITVFCIVRGRKSAVLRNTVFWHGSGPSKSTSLLTKFWSFPCYLDSCDIVWHLWARPDGVIQKGSSSWPWAWLWVTTWISNCINVKQWDIIRSSDNDSTGFWPPGSLHTLGADGHI